MYLDISLSLLNMQLTVKTFSFYASTPHSALKNVDKRTLLFTASMHILMNHKAFLKEWVVISSYNCLKQTIATSFGTEKQENFSDEIFLLLTHCVPPPLSKRVNIDFEMVSASERQKTIFFPGTLISCFWPTRPRPNRWSLFSLMVSVRPSVTKTNKHYNANVGARKTKYALRRTPCMKIMTTHIWLGPGGSS